MNPNPFNEPPSSTLADGARDAASKAGEVAQEAYKKTTEVAHKAGEVAQEAYKKTTEVAHKAGEVAQEAYKKTADAAHAGYDAACAGCEDTLTRTRAYVQENPLPAVLGAFALGAILSFALSGGRRHEATLRERYVDDPLESIRDTIFAALVPVGKRIHDQYDVARDSAEEALEHAQDSASRHANSWGKQLRRASNNLKFW